MNFNEIYKNLDKKYEIIGFNWITLQLKVIDNERKTYIIAYHSLCVPYSLWI